MSNILPQGSDSNDCVFCAQVAHGPRTVAWDAAVAFPDGYPITPGHTLVVPRTHVADLFDLAPPDLAAVWRLVAYVRDVLTVRERPDGFTVGVNVGAAAGQTVPHAHVHVVPRRWGDVADPRGGVRWVVPAEAAYW